MKTTPIAIANMMAVIPEQSVLELVGQIAGECYNSSKDSDACVRRALNCIRRGHHSPWEHFNITLKCTVDRGTSHALVRHRHCAFQQSSTIYQKLDEIVVVVEDGRDLSEEDRLLYAACEARYKEKLAEGLAPSEARDVLPTNLATNLIITTNIRQWMYMLQRRCGPGDSDKMHAWCSIAYKWFADNYPRITAAFEVWYEKHPL